MNTVPIGLMNGSIGTVVDIVFDQTTDVLEISYVIVDFPSIELPCPFYADHPTWVPMYAYDHSAEMGSRCQLGPRQDADLWQSSTRYPARKFWRKSHGSND